MAATDKDSSLCILGVPPAQGPSPQVLKKEYRHYFTKQVERMPAKRPAKTDPGEPVSISKAAKATVKAPEKQAKAKKLRTGALLDTTGLPLPEAVKGDREGLLFLESA